MNKSIDTSIDDPKKKTKPSKTKKADKEAGEVKEKKVAKPSHDIYIREPKQTLRSIKTESFLPEVKQKRNEAIQPKIIK